jgi:hypothetical protein
MLPSDQSVSDTRGRSVFDAGEDRDDAGVEEFAKRLFGDSFFDLQKVGFDHAVYARMVPLFRQSARDLVSEETTYFETKQLNGRMWSPVRAAIPGDGRAFRRRTYVETTEATVAMLFDCSHSTKLLLPTFLPVAAALCDAIRAQSGVEVALWRFGSHVEVISAEELKRPKLLGATKTGEALAAARQWFTRLNNHLAAKFVFLFTDGAADDPLLADQESVLLRSMGVKLLIGAMNVEECKVAFPGAAIFNVHPAAAASSLKSMATRIHAQAL